MANIKYITLENLSYFYQRMKEYIDVKTDLAVNKTTNCPNCGAPITAMKCPYCGTDFNMVMKIG